MRGRLACSSKIPANGSLPVHGNMPQVAGMPSRGLYGKGHAPTGLSPGFTGRLPLRTYPTMVMGFWVLPQYSLRGQWDGNLRGRKGRLFYKVNIFSRIASAAAAVNGGSGLKWSGKNARWVPDRGPGCSCLFCPVPQLLTAYCVLSGSGTPARSQVVCGRSWQKRGIWASGTGPLRQSPWGRRNLDALQGETGCPREF